MELGSHSSPAISVLIPSYNRCLHLHRLLLSLRQQTFHNFEVIVVDDGSTDGTAALAQEFTSESVRFISGFHEGVASALNLGIRECKGIFIMVMHDHDEYEATLFEELHDLLVRWPNAAFAHSGVVEISADGQKIVASYLRDYPTITRGLDFLTHSLLPGIPSVVSALTMFRKEFAGTPAFDESLGSTADVELWLRLCTIGDVAYTPSPLISIRRRDSGSSFYNQDLDLAKQVLAAKRRYLPLVRSGWRRIEIRFSWIWDCSRLVVLLRASRQGAGVDGKEFLRGEFGRMGGLAGLVVEAVPQSVLLAARAVRRSFRRPLAPYRS